MTRQLPLRFPLRERFVWRRFVAGANAELVERLRAPQDGFMCCWLWGAPGVGKSHLLQALCREEGGVYLPATETRGLDGLEAFERVCIDDVDAWFGDRRAEEALFHLHNELFARGHALTVASRRPPREAPFALPDLASRLRGAAIFEVRPLTEAGTAAALVHAAADRGIELGDDAVRYLLLRTNRDLATLLTLLDAIDGESLASGRRVTVPLVKRALTL